MRARSTYFPVTKFQKESVIEENSARGYGLCIVELNLVTGEYEIYGPRVWTFCEQHKETIKNNGRQVSGNEKLRQRGFEENSAS